jgi:hypothetical protein
LLSSAAGKIWLKWSNNIKINVLVKVVYFISGTPFCYYMSQFY